MLFSLRESRNELLILKPEKTKVKNRNYIFLESFKYNYHMSSFFNASFLSIFKIRICIITAEQK